MKVTKEMLRHLIIGKVMGDSFEIEDAKKAKEIALELIEFMEEQDMFKDDVK
jgi:hypothetical protein